MSPRELKIESDIRRASTLPGWTYTDPEFFERQKERVFARTWQWAADATRVRAPGRVFPFTLLDGCLSEPLVLTSDDDGATRCLSNVCTHRGAIVVEGEGHARSLRCRYHGRRFGLDGQPPQTLEEVGNDLGITRERVRQLETRALRELRMVAPGLQLYLGNE